jgi:hypothetical protein
MPVWFPVLDELETFIPEPEWLRPAMFDDASYEAENSLEGIDDEQDFFDSAEQAQDFGNSSMAFSDDPMLLDGNDSMFYFDSMRDMEDLRNTR